MNLRRIVLLALPVAASASVALAQPARPGKAEPVRPLTFEEAKGLSDAQVIDRAFKQLAAKTMKLERPASYRSPLSFSDPYFNYLVLNLRPKAAEGVKNLCEMARIAVRFVPTDAKAWPDLKRRLGDGPRIRLEIPSVQGAPPQAPEPAPDLYEPAMEADSLSQSSLFKIVGPMSSAGFDADTRAKCARLEKLDGFISAPSGDALREAVWLLGEATAAAKAKPGSFKLDCYDIEAECLGMLSGLSTDRLLGVSPCPEFDAKAVRIPANYTCTHLNYFNSGDPSRAMSYTAVDIISQTSSDGTRTWAAFDSVMISTRMMVVD